MSVNAMQSRETTQWHLWKSDNGGWYATRVGDTLTDQELLAGLAMTVAADSQEERGRLLAEQDAIAQNRSL